jgi:hypothetical protein
MSSYLISKRKAHRLNSKVPGKHPVVKDESLINLIKLHQIWYKQEETKKIFRARHYGQDQPYTLESAFPESSSKPSYTALVAEAKARGLSIPTIDLCL